MLRMLESVRITPEDLVVDLGAGDGKIAIAAAKLYGARALGIEYNPSLAALAQRQAEQAGVSDRVQIVAADLFTQDFSKATVVTLYLLEELNFRLRPTLLAMKPGTRVVSNTFSMGDWDPDEVISVQGHTAYRWVVPASVAGRWALNGLSSNGQAILSLQQQFQRIGGHLEIQGQTQTLLGAELQGSQLSFRYLGADGFLKVVRLQVQGENLQGEILGPFGMVEVPVPNVKVLGQRVGNRLGQR
jgi:SAM-dependent methyltransferase